MKPNWNWLAKVWRSDYDGDLIHGESVTKHDKARRCARRKRNRCFARECKRIHRVRRKPIDRVRFDRNDQVHQVVVEVRHHVRCENCGQAAAQLSGPDCRRGSMTCSLRRSYKTPSFSALAARSKDRAHADNRGKRQHHCSRCLDADRARSLFRDDEFRRVRTAQDRKIVQALFVKPVDGQSEQGFAGCAKMNWSSRL
jgi:hypothetical protein